MAEGYCSFHQRFLTRKEVKIKRCRCKPNTRKVCKYFINTAKQRYRNDTNFIRLR